MRKPQSPFRLIQLPEMQTRHPRTTTGAGDDSKIQRSSFGEWLRKLAYKQGAAHGEVLDEIKREELKRRMAGLLGHLVVQMSRRDLRMYLRILSADHTGTLRELRFEYFDLLCRKLGETVALEHLREFDAVLAR